MNSTEETRSAIIPSGTLVTGDFIIDQHIYEGERYHYADSSPGVGVKVEVGGAGKLADVLEKLFEKLPPGEFQDVRDVFPARVPPPLKAGAEIVGSMSATPLAYHAYAFWRRQPQHEPREKQYWRCVEAMGFGASEVKSPSDVPPVSGRLSAKDAPCASWPVKEGRPAHPALIVISEGGMGFRENESCWEKEKFADANHIVLKTANNPTSSKLWTELTGHAARLTVIVSASELRKSNARISAGLTWDETFQDLLGELAPNGRLHELTNCRKLIVTFDNEAAFALCMVKPKQLSGAQVSFVYRAADIEADAKHDTSGTAFGFLTCFTAAITRALVCADPADLPRALSEGLTAMRNLLNAGHGPATEAPVGFPVDRIVKAILNPPEHFTEVTLRYEEVADCSWTFLRLAEPSATSKTKAAFELAGLTTIYGPVAIANVPHLRIGDLVSVDGEEITALRNLRQVLRRYDRSDDGKKPLSIGVFGPPGAGKSFAVKQIAANLLGKRSHWLEFNLSQFDGPADLIGAFHQVRDQVLQGKLPVAFFDEFDSRKYHWLQYLLAPMQDGSFQQGELTHAIGKSVFIFAGGTSWTFDTFGPPTPPTGDADRHAEEAASAFRLAKGPDFQSRLDAYLNVVGPNPRVRELTAAGAAMGSLTKHHVGGRVMVEDEQDIWWPIRRALMVRSSLKLNPDHKLEIDPGLLQALLRVGRYKHGSRSLEKILAPMQTSKTFSLSFIPHHSQLELHTNADEFLRLAGQRHTPRSPTELSLSETDLTVIAEAIHATWNELMVRAGDMRPAQCQTLDERTREWSDKKRQLADEKLAIERATYSEELKSRELARIAADLKKIPSELSKIASNTAAAKRMQLILDIIGLRMKRGALALPASEQLALRRRLEFHLELLSSEEHRSWMTWYLEQGWTYDPKRDDVKLKHNCLKPYSELPEKEKMKDRASIRNYPQYARNAEFLIESSRTSGALDQDVAPLS